MDGIKSASLASKTDKPAQKNKTDFLSNIEIRTLKKDLEKIFQEKKAKELKVPLPPPTPPPPPPPVALIAKKEQTPQISSIGQQQQQENLQKSLKLQQEKKLQEEKEKREKEINQTYNRILSLMASKSWREAQEEAKKIIESPDASKLLIWKTKRLQKKAEEEIEKETSLTLSLLTEEKPALNNKQKQPELKIPSLKLKPETPNIQEKELAKPQEAPIPPKTAPSMVNGIDRQQKIFISKKIIILISLTLLAVFLISWLGWQQLEKRNSAFHNFLNPIPSPSSSPSPLPSQIPSSFINTEKQIIAEIIPTQPTETLTQLNQKLLASELPPGSFAHLIFKNNSTNGFASLDEILKILELNFFYLPSPPCTTETKDKCPKIIDFLSPNNFSFLIFYNTPNSSSDNLKTDPRLSLIIQLNPGINEAQFFNVFKSLEDSLLAKTGSLWLERKTNLPITSSFQDNIYRGISIRYQNFPTADISFDYAVLKNKFIVATSKQAMYAILEKLLSSEDASSESFSNF